MAKRPLLIKLKYIWLFISDLYRNFPVYVIAITILALFQGIPLYFSSIYLAKLIDSATNISTTMQGFLILLSIYVISITGSVVIDYLKGTIMDYYKNEVKDSFKMRLLRVVSQVALKSLENHKFYKRIDRAFNAINIETTFTIYYILDVIESAIKLITLCIVVYQIRLEPLFAFFIIGFIGYFNARILKNQYDLEQKQVDDVRKQSALNRVMTSRNTALEVRIYGLKDYLLNKWEQLNSKLIKERIHLALSESKDEIKISLFKNLSFAISIIILTVLMFRRSITLGEFITLIYISQQILDNSEFLFWRGALLMNSTYYIRDLFRVLRMKPNKEIEQRGYWKQAYLKNVTFKYPGSKENTLNKINLTLNKGERIAIVGPNGAGKSTLAKLIIGLYSPNDGEVYVDKYKLTKNEPLWGRQASAVFQEYGRYLETTVYNNIAFGDVSRLHERNIVKHSASLAGCTEMVQAMPMGMDTYLGKEFGGVELSTGQWQKLAFARGHMREAEIMLLDEPTAALDAKTEYEVFHNFLEMAAGKTAIIISHRLGITQLMDRIIVMNKGEIIDHGNHEELFDRCTLYRDMYLAQSSLYN